MCDASSRLNSESSPKDFITPSSLLSGMNNFDFFMRKTTFRIAHRLHFFGFLGSIHLCWWLDWVEKEESNRITQFCPEFCCRFMHTIMHNLWHDFPSLFIRQHRDVQGGKRKKKKRWSELCKNKTFNQYINDSLLMLRWSMQQCFECNIFIK